LESRWLENDVLYMWLMVLAGHEVAAAAGAISPATIDAMPSAT